MQQNSKSNTVPRLVLIGIRRKGQPGFTLSAKAKGAA